MNGVSGQVAGRRSGHTGQPAMDAAAVGVVLTEWAWCPEGDAGPNAPGCS